MDYIARWSLAKRTGADGQEGWGWKFDPSIWQRFFLRFAARRRNCLKETRCRVALFKGEKSILWEDDVGDYMRGLLKSAGAFHRDPGGAPPHHAGPAAGLRGRAADAVCRSGDIRRLTV
jgi:hypothetical protein